ncbi:MAG: hypothetical protein GY928_35880 [Colwellia sp.]|nr:hypothetical protein [Colwellia sp.]
MNWERGNSAAFDITVVSSLCQTHVSRAANVPGYSTSLAENAKISKHGENCKLENIIFVPLAVDSFGGWGELALDTFDKLARRLADYRGKDRNEEITRIYQRLSIELQRQNGEMFILRK